MAKPPKILFIAPATSGYYALSLCYDEGGAICDAAREPVVAWALDEVGLNYPVTMNHGLHYGRYIPAILCPDGVVRSRCQDPDGVVRFRCKDWCSLYQWLKEQDDNII